MMTSLVAMHHKMGVIQGRYFLVLNRFRVSRLSAAHFTQTLVNSAPPPPPQSPPGGFISSRPKCLVQQNEQHHRKVLHRSLNFNGHTLGFHPQTKSRATLYSIKTAPQKVLLNTCSFHLNGHTGKSTPSPFQ